MQYDRTHLGRKRATLEFCGFSPVRVMRIDRLRYKNEGERSKILKKVEKFVSI